ncbi:hypothetical protein CF327_g7322 [Tilletia walkeri]|nr:hypothetical protein CF327_g7322 [Tilletia walkeri]
MKGFWKSGRDRTGAEVMACFKSRNASHSSSPHLNSVPTKDLLFGCVFHPLRVPPAFPELALSTLADTAIFESQRTESSQSPIARKRQRIDRATLTSGVVQQQQIATGLPPQQPSSASLADSKFQQLPSAYRRSDPAAESQVQNRTGTAFAYGRCPAAISSTGDKFAASTAAAGAAAPAARIPPKAHTSCAFNSRTAPLRCCSWDSVVARLAFSSRIEPPSSRRRKQRLVFISCSPGFVQRSRPALREEGSAHDAPPPGPALENKADPPKALPLPISSKGMVSPSVQRVDFTEHQVSSDQPPQPVSSDQPFEPPLVLPTVASAPPTEVAVQHEDVPSTSEPAALIPSAKPHVAPYQAAPYQVAPYHSLLPVEIFTPPAHVSSNAPYNSFPFSQPLVPTHSPLADAVVAQLSSSSANPLQPVVPRTAIHLQYTPPPLWRIDLNRYRKGDCVGVGTQGSVFKCIDTLHKRPVAVKISKCDSRGRPPNTMLREISALRTAVHANIVYLTDILFDGTDIGIVLPLCDSSLRSLITSNMGFGRNLSLQTLTSCLRQILEGLHYLHEHRKFAHFDLKPENILVDNNEHVRLADFGLCRPPNLLNS